MCLLVGSFVHYKMEKWDILLSFQDIFTKLGGHLPLELPHRLAKIKIFGLCVCQLINLFNANGKNGYFAQFSRYIYQLWLTSSTGAIHILAKIKFHKFVCQLLHLLTL